MFKRKFINDNDDVSNSISLLISILVCFPELGSVNFLPDTQQLKFTFILKNQHLNDSKEQFDDKLHTALDAFHQLIGAKAISTKITKTLYENFTAISILRDLNSLTREEIFLLNQIVYNHFVNEIVSDSRQSLLEDEIHYQEELIDSMLESVKQVKLDKGIFAFREEGRVMVFNK